jgi:OFA family oxalate/formate antiporter-like MFS transporter
MYSLKVDNSEAERSRFIMDNAGLSQPQETKPRFFYGYIIVGLCFLIMMAAFGLYDSYGIFVKPLITTFNWTRATTSAAYSLSFLIFGFVGIVLGGLTDRFGPRVILTACGLFLGMGYILMSQLSSLWQLYFFYGIIIGIGMSSLYAPILSLIARWFVEKRGLMTGIVLSGLGIGQLVAPPLISRLVAAYDWSFSYIILGIILLVIVVVATQFLRRDPSQVGQVPYGAKTADVHATGSASLAYSLREASRTRQFWVLVGIKLCYGFYMFSMVVHIIPHATDLGISTVDAANILAIHGAAMVLGSFMLGRVGDRIGPRKVFIICFVIALVSLLWLMQARALWSFFIFAIFLGVANGGNVASDSPMAARLFGLKWLGSIVGVSSCAFSVGVALGPSITGLVFDATGSYQAAFIICAAVSAAGIVLASIQTPTKKLQQRI